MDDLQILATLKQLSDGIYEIRKGILKRNGFHWKDIVHIDKVNAIMLCRERHNIDVVTAKKMVDDYLLEV